MALEKLDGVSAAYVDKNVDIHLAEGGSLDKEEIAKILKLSKMTVKTTKKLDKLPF